MNISGNTKNGEQNNLAIYTLKYGSEDGTRHVYIDAGGLDCESSIGITITIYNYDLLDKDAKYFAEGLGTGAVPATNCANAYSDRVFFSDGAKYNVIYPGSRGTFLSGYSGSYVDSKIYMLRTHRSVASNATANYEESESGTTITVKTYQGLAYVMKQVNDGVTDYDGKTINLAADIDLYLYSWEPIGERHDEANCATGVFSTVAHPFRGTFNGQGHTIRGLRSILATKDMGLFGYVDGGVVENVFFMPSTNTQIYNTNTVSVETADNIGTIVGYLHGGTVSNCEAAVTLTGGSGTIVGGLVGKADSYTVSGTTYASSIHSCCAMPTFGGSGTVGGLVGQLASGCSLKNSFSNTASGIPGLVGSNAGTVNNCYVRTTTSFIGSGTAVTNCYALGSASGNYTATSTPYLYNHADNQVVGANMSLLDKLNAGRESGHTEWTRTMASPINDDYPILKYTAYNNCVGSTDGRVLQYGTSLATLMTNIADATGNNIYLYGNAGTQAAPITAANTSRGIYIAPDAALIHTNAIANAHVGVTLDPTNGSEGVH